MARGKIWRRCELLAFNLYLCSLKQLCVQRQQFDNSCELLAFNLYLCSLKQPLGTASS